MNYIEQTKDLIRKNLRVGKNLQDFYALLILIKGEDITLKDVHDAWAVNQNRIFPEHFSVKPFEELTEEVQNKDLYYLEKLKAVAKEMKELDIRRD